ncbi:hypothetical protein LPJ57_008364 [Coemansia sp. RSA 486]|nr:hypothetical protein LPJ57_008364 [Coemansia sp. RSA 486]
MSNHDSFPYATDQNAEHHEQHPASFTGHADSPHASSLLSSVLPSQTGSLSASPQLRVPSVAPINTSPAPSSVSNLTLAPSSEIFYSSTVTHQADCAVYTIDQTEAKVMEQKVRQFYAADGASFIEHVPGHCLVFIPNTTNVDYVLHELRKIRQPRRRNRAPKDKSNKPTNAFIKYRNHKIVELKRMHPEISQTEISRMAGECWRTEPEELKEAFRRKYQEEKRVYDMNKAKNAAAAATAESEIGSDGEALSDTLSSSSMSVPGRASATPHIEAHGGPSINSLGLGFGLDGNPVGFNTGRRRSHTLPPGGFTRSGAKRRISQELRKHLANKKSSAYMAAASATCNGSMGVGAFADSMQVYPAQQSQQLLPPPPPYEFTFTAPQIDSSTCSSTIGGASPYMGGNTSGSPMLIPLNPNFPLADFTTQADPSTSSAPVHVMQNQHHHTRSLTSVSASLPLGASVFATTTTDSGFGSLVSNPAGMSKSFTDSSVNGSLPMIDTSNLNVFANDGMSINAFSAGYLGPDPSPWPMTSAYTILPDSTSSSSTATSSIASAQLQQQQQQQQDHAVQNYPSQSHHSHY